MQQYIVRLFQHSDQRSHQHVTGFVETMDSVFKKDFKTLDELHAILKTLEDGRERCNVIWVRDMLR